MRLYTQSLYVPSADLLTIYTGSENVGADAPLTPEPPNEPVTAAFPFIGCESIAPTDVVFLLTSTGVSAGRIASVEIGRFAADFENLSTVIDGRIRDAIPRSFSVVGTEEIDRERINLSLLEEDINSGDPHNVMFLLLWPRLLRDVHENVSRLGLFEKQAHEPMRRRMRLSFSKVALPPLTSTNEAVSELELVT
jgi:hypothetical protein